MPPISLKSEKKRYINFAHTVKSVTYDHATDDFVVVVKDLKNDVVLQPHRFSHVIVASGHYSTPNIPSIPGIESFTGRLLHSHDFRGAEEFSGKTMLLIGAALTAEDIALQLVKFGAKRVVVSWRTRPPGSCRWWHATSLETLSPTKWWPL